MLEAIRGVAAAFRDALPAAAATQERLLLRLVQENRRTEYGRRHDFGAVGSYRDFALRVPIASYEDMRPLIERAADGAPAVLTAEPVVAFEETGGSSGGAKLIPYTEAALEAFRRGVAVWLDDLYEHFPALHAGTAYWAISPAGRSPRATSAGVPIGLDDFGYLGATLGAEIARTLSVPLSVAALRDLDAWREATAAHLLAAADLALISVWSPTYLLELLDYMRANAAVLVARIEGGFESRRGDPERAARAAAALGTDPPDYAALWPRLTVLSAWTHAASSGPAARLVPLFPSATLQGKGLLATEGLCSIPLTGIPAPVLAFESGFVEFLGADGRACACADVVVGEEYEILLTNASGLYRYAIGDRVRIDGFAGTAPRFEFLGRSGVATDLVGEKLCEAFVAKVLAPLRLRFAALAPDGDAYALIVDAAEVAPEAAARYAEDAERALRANPQYAHARNLRQLAAARAVLVREPWQAHVAAALARGQRLGDIKPLALVARSDWRQQFRAAPTS